MTGWLSYQSVMLLFGLSVAGFVGTLIVIPWILVRLPPYYFDERHPRTWMKDHHPVLRAVTLGLKNVVGMIFLLAGIAMLVLPGQGILTMLIGLSLLDFPGKRSLERLIVRRPLVLQGINRLRERFNRPPLVICPSEQLGG